MANQYAGRFYDALLDTNTKLLKSSVFHVYTDAAATVPATTYTDRTKVSQASVLVTDFSGMAEFYAVPGTYYLRIDENSPVRKITVYEDVEDTADVAELIADIATHSADTTAVHGIADTAVLETQSGALAKATAARDAAIAASQPLDSDLTAFAALTPANDDIPQRKGGVWVSRTPAQLKADLGLTTITGQFIGAAATFGALPTTDTAGAAASNGDWAFLTADVVGTGTSTDPQYPRGAYVYNGSSFSLNMAIGGTFEAKNVFTSDTWLCAIAAAGAFRQLSSVTRDSNDVMTSASVTWPDGVTGTFTATTVSIAFPGAIDAFTVTYVGSSTRTVTQSAVTRNANGYITDQPAMTVA